MTRHSSKDNSALIPSGATLCDVATDKKAAKALENATSKYAHVVPGNIWRHADGKHLVVLILCTHPNCTTKRAIFTSDAFQCSTCADHKASASKPVKAEKAPGKRVSLKDAPKGTRKGKKQEKATKRAPRGKGKGPKSDTTTTTAEAK